MKKEIVFFGVLIMMIGFVTASGVSSPVWRGNPLEIAAGETKSVEMALQNMGTSEDVNMRVTMTESAGIASVEEKVYLVRMNTKDTLVPVVVTIPEGTPVGTEYLVTLTFESVIPSSGGVSLGTGMVTSFDVVVVPYTPSVEEPKLAPLEIPSYVYWIVGLIILIIVVAIIVKRMRKSRAVEKKKTR